MAYTWQNGETITADKLNNTNGIMIVNCNVSGTVSTLNRTYKEIYDFMESGGIVLIKEINTATEVEDWFDVSIVSGIGKEEGNTGLYTVVGMYSYRTDSLNGYPSYDMG